MSNGWVKIYRKMMDKPYYKKSEYVHMWDHILLKANHSDSEFVFNNKNITIKRGQFLTGRKSLSKETGIHESKIERILTYFEKTEQQIEQQKTNKYRIITVLNYEQYQSTEQQNEQQMNNKRTTNEQQVNTNKNDKKKKNDNNDKKKYPHARAMNKIEDWLLKRFKIKLTHRKETGKLMKQNGQKYIVGLALRFDTYQKAFNIHGWNKRYRLEKRWGNVILNLNCFDSDEALKEKFEDVAAKNSPTKKYKKSTDPLPVDNSPTPTREEKIKNIEKIIAQFEADPPTGAGDISQYKMMKAKLERLKEGE